MKLILEYIICALTIIVLIFDIVSLTYVNLTSNSISLKVFSLILLVGLLCSITFLISYIKGVNDAKKK